MRAIWMTLAVAAALHTGSGSAQQYPAKPVRFIVPFAAGGGLDITGRLLAQQLNEQSGYTAIVDNRPGANGNLGAELAAKASADGYTLLMSAVTLQVINSALYSKLPYDLMRDFAPISLLTYAPLFLAVHPSLPVKNVKEFIALAKSRPGRLNYGSSGTGSSLHLAGVMFDKAAGIKTNHVPYRGGGPAAVDLAAGQIEFLYPLLGIVQNFVDTGRIRLLGVAALKRYPDLPNLPTIAEQGVAGFEAETVYGLLAPANTPRPILDKLNADVVKALAAPEMKRKLAEQGMTAQPTTGEEFTKYLRRDLAKYSKVVKESGIQVDF